jgi:hypothetical protein
MIVSHLGAYLLGVRRALHMMRAAAPPLRCAAARSPISSPWRPLLIIAGSYRALLWRDEYRRASSPTLRHVRKISMVYNALHQGRCGPAQLEGQRRNRQRPVHHLERLALGWLDGLAATWDVVLIIQDGRRDERRLVGNQSSSTYGRDGSWRVTLTTWMRHLIFYTRLAPVCWWNICVALHSPRVSRSCLDQGHG